jgi:hypothetical protein
VTRSAFRDECNALTKKALSMGSEPFGKDVEYVLHVGFMAPTKRHYDMDNLLSRMKSGIDGVCDALGINDRQFVRLDVFRLSRHKSCGECVVLFITEEEERGVWPESTTR